LYFSLSLLLFLLLSFTIFFYLRLVHFSPLFFLLPMNTEQQHAAMLWQSIQRLSRERPNQ
jgi:hypothetical protein